VVGTIGSHLRQSNTTIGDTVNTGRRLESMTKEEHCDILISGAVEAVQRSFLVAETRSEGKFKGQEDGEPEVLGHCIDPRQAAE
jgi:class 3 adenylate cyclase